MAFQCGAVSTKFFQWYSSVPCKYSLGSPVVSQCTLGQPVAFQWHSSVHWTSQCTLAQGKGPCKQLGVWASHRDESGFASPIHMTAGLWYCHEEVILGFPKRCNCQGAIAWKKNKLYLLPPKVTVLRRFQSRGFRLLVEDLFQDDYKE